MFPKVKQLWLGYSEDGNGGKGLGKDFADSMSRALSGMFSNFGREDITKGSHLEKLVLFNSGIGKDNVSDFTANLIKSYIAEYTEVFAKKQIAKELCKKAWVNKAVFNYETETWQPREYYLPYSEEIRDYVLLTPKNILRRKDTWIHRTDMIKDFESFIPSIENDVLRTQVNKITYIST
jgi:hypothetical protein